MNETLKGLIALAIMGIIVCIVNILVIAYDNGDEWETYANGKRGRRLTVIGRTVSGLKKIFR